MPQLKLSFACWDYDRMKALEDGRVKPEGIELNFLNYRYDNQFIDFSIRPHYDAEWKKRKQCSSYPEF
jgi:hypothetical protein